MNNQVRLTISDVKLKFFSHQKREVLKVLRTNAKFAHLQSHDTWENSFLQLKAPE